MEKKIPGKIKSKRREWMVPNLLQKTGRNLFFKKSFMEQLLLIVLANTGIFMQNMYIERSQVQYLLCQNLKIYFQLKQKLSSITHFSDGSLSLVFVSGG